MYYIILFLVLVVFMSVMLVFLSIVLTKKSITAEDIKKYEKIEMRPLKNLNTKSSTKTAISTIHPASYESYHRVKDKFKDNMNYRLYRCRAIFLETNRKRSVTLEAFDSDDAMKQLQNSGFIEPYEIERMPFPECSDAQKTALGNICFDDVCKYDASAILSRRYDKDSIPNPELISYATECNIKFSYYIGKRALYDLIFNTLDLKDKIAFFVFCVYRYTTNDRCGNLNRHHYKDLFYKFSDKNISNESFIKSMNKYSGNELRFFGTLTFEHETFYGGSTKTIAYKTAIEFLKQHFSLTNISNKRIIEL